MEKALNSKLCEMTEEEMMELEGGKINVPKIATNFIVNRFVYTVVKTSYRIGFVPYSPSNSSNIC